MTQPSRPAPRLAVMRALWSAGLLAPPLYGAVGWIARGHLAASLGASSTLFAIVFGALALGISIALLVFRRPLAAAAGFEPVSTFMVRFALVEAVALLGLVLLLLAGPWMVAVMLLVWSLGLMIVIRPTEEDQETLARWSSGR
jgi:hypothetical protein